MKSPVELNSLFLNFFVISLGLIRSNTGRLANEAFMSNPIVSLKEQLSGLKITNCYITKCELNASVEISKKMEIFFES